MSTDTPAMSELEHHWLPFTANRDFKRDPRLLVKAEGMYYWNHQGERILDASSGLFCCAAGHCRTEITHAVTQQLQTLDYTPHFQLASPLSFTAAKRLAQLTPTGLDRIFFSASGSDAVDTSLKIALAYHRAKGEGQRTRFISRERAYHGVNMGGTALSGLVNNRLAFGAGLATVAHLRHTWLPENRFSRGLPAHGAELADDLLRMVQLYGKDTIAACYIEPIAGSTGAVMPPVGYLKRIREICDEYDILLVFDEVITGFGRTGKAFASQSFDVTPDIMIMAKAITNAAIPMGAVAVKREIYQAIVDHAPSGGVEFFHGYTYSGHPVACAAMLATLDIYEQEQLFERGETLSPYFLDAMFNLQDIPIITDIRGYGMLVGMDFAPTKKAGERGGLIQKALFKAGLHVKTTGDAGIIAPALIAEREHIDTLCDILHSVLKGF